MCVPRVRSGEGSILFRILRQPSLAAESYPSMAPSDSDLNELFGEKEATPASEEPLVTHDQIFGEILRGLGGTPSPTVRPGDGEAPTGPIAAARARGPVRVQLAEPVEGRLQRLETPQSIERLDALIAEFRGRETRAIHPRSKKMAIAPVEELLGLDTAEMAPPLAQGPPSTETDILDMLEAEKRAPEADTTAVTIAPGEETPADAAASLVELDLAELVEDAVAGRRPFLPAEPLKGAYGPYELIERVAVGGMAEVYRARRSGPEGFAKTLALKRILPHLATRPDFVDLFVNEAKMVSRLEHPNIVGIQELGRTGNSYYIAMEFVNGQDLRAILERLRNRGRKMPLDIAVFLGRKVCAALDYAHKAKQDDGSPVGIVHSDISPQNILVSYEGEVKLTDFGVAKASSRASEGDDGLLRGKLFYMSPEQASGEPVDHRSDIFSLGIVLYEMTTGVKPFSGGDEGALYAALRGGRVQAPSNLNAGIPDRLSETILKALERDQDHRFEDAAALSKALERSLDGPGVETPELARFMELLFDDRPRPAAPPAHASHATGTGSVAVVIEVDDGTAGGEGVAMPSLERIATAEHASTIKRAWKKIFG